MPRYYTHYPRTILWLVRGGECVIGGEEADSQPRFRVEMPSFYIGKFPITNEQFEAFSRDFSRSPLSPGDHDPASGVTFDEAEAYCTWYAEISRKPIRLPTEIEWEYACRGNIEKMFFCGNDLVTANDFIWHSGNSQGRVRPLDQKKPNPFGLFGMLGGVWEWTSSSEQSYPLTQSATGSPADEEVMTSLLPDKHSRRILRGGSVLTPLSEISCSCRRSEIPSAKKLDIGFRVLKTFS